MSTDSSNGAAKKSASPQSETGSTTTSGDWIEKFADYTKGLSSPPLFSKWAAICAIAGALERKVWVRTKGSPLYPNLYCILVSPPGIGKTEVIWRTRSFWDSLEDHHTANSSVTKASLIDDLAEAPRRIIRPNDNPPYYSFNSLLVASNELGVLISAYESEFMHALTDLYDGKPYSESRRTKNLKIKINHPNINIIAGCTPGYLRETLPPGAWDQGFLSRVLLIYSGEQELTSLFIEEEEDNALRTELEDHLKEIGEYFGQAKFTQEAKEFIDHWYLNGQAPRPDHPRLIHYNTRRPAHLLKLSIISLAASSPTRLLIERHHIERALDWLVEAEFEMTEIFKSMSAGGDSQLIEDTYHHLFTLYIKEGKKPISQARMVYFLQERTPAHNIVRILEIMEKSKMIERKLVPKLGEAYVPKSERPK